MKPFESKEGGAPQWPLSQSRTEKVIKLPKKRRSVGETGIQDCCPSERRKVESAKKPTVGKGALRNDRFPKPNSLNGIMKET